MPSYGSYNKERLFPREVSVMETSLQCFFCEEEAKFLKVNLKG